MPAGKRDTLITIERFTSTTDEYGDPVQAWTELGKEWAQVFWGRGDERRSAAMEQGAQPATFLMLSNPRTRDLTVKDRIVLAGVAWDIQGVAPMNRADVEVTAVRAA